jgi:predicted SnoaL-like aldol condensation-catalyzing enzyme
MSGRRAAEARGSGIAAEDNKQLVRRLYEEVWEKGNLEVAGGVFARDYVRHDLRPTTAAPGPEGQQQIAGAFRAAFPDLHFDVEIVIAEGDKSQLGGPPRAPTRALGAPCSRPAGS